MILDSLQVQLHYIASYHVKLLCILSRMNIIDSRLMNEMRRAR